MPIEPVPRNYSPNLLPVPAIAQPVILTVMLCMAVRVSLAAAGAAVSANGQFAVDLSRTPDGQLLVSVFQVGNGQKTLSWTRAGEWQSDRRAPGLAVYDVRPLVTGDGETVLLREYQGAMTTNGVKIVGRKASDTWQGHPFRNSELIGLEDNVRFRPDTTYRGVPCVFDFILDDDRTYAAWFGQTDKWLTLSLETHEFSVVRDKDLVARLNAHAHDWAEQLVLEHQPPPLRRALETVRNQVAKMVPSLPSSSRQPFLSGDAVTAYLFVATRKFPSDRRYIEGLASYPLAGVHQADIMVGPTLNAWYWPYERLFGDWLLSRWDGEPNRAVRQQRETIMLFPLNYLYSLASLTVNLDLGLPPPALSGILWAYAIPSDVASGEWSTSRETIALKAAIPANLAEENNRRAVSTITFQSLTPGSYRIKLVWERHPPAGLWRTNIYRAQPGDFESLESSPVTVVKGQVSSVTLACTNRVGGADAYIEDEKSGQRSSGK